MNIKGTFEVDMNPLEFRAEGADGINLSRMSIEKKLDGDLKATSRGEMLSATTPVKGSAGYAAVDRVSGTLS